ncbi:hypothetical protein [Streptomyces sp. SudanB25_2051]|uniref:NACHT domain-containing protein n=1 Tax=Streptomyces sp. SudanB25_2051 TaxID=3035275 RepID=UPI003F57030B
MAGRIEWPSLVPWERKLVVMGPQTHTDYGWGLDGAFGARAGVALKDLRHRPVVVLRAERGAGKSEAFRQEHDTLRAAGLPSMWVDLGRCQDALIARDSLQAAFSPPKGEGEWFVLLDGLDEGLNAVPALAQHIAARLGAVPEAAWRRLRIRISCRSGRWPQTLYEDLARLWSRDDVDMRGLAPLSRSDVALAASISGIQSTESFMGAVQERRLVALAVHPVTLRQMVITYGESGSLPRTAHEAYLDACRHLCTESKRPNDPVILDRQVPAGDLMSVATRIAASAQFGGHAAISDHPQPATGDLSVTLLSGGSEPGPLGVGVDCTLRELRQVLESGLFVPVGEQRWKFAHRSYQEFLAAQFLANRQIHPEVQRELLWIGAGPARHVLSAHQEVAAWRCVNDRELFEELLQDDPLVLQAADLQALPDARRAEAVAAFLAHFEDDETASFQWDALPRFAHPGLAGQIRRLLHDPTQTNLLYTAVALADACHTGGLDSELLTIAENQSLPSEIRVRAISAIRTPAEAVIRIKALTTDSSPDVVAGALERLWPDHVGLDQYLDLVPEPDPAYLGTAYALHEQLPTALDRKDLRSALAWALRTLSDQDSTGSRTLAMALITQAVLNMEPDHTGAGDLADDIVAAMLALSECGDGFLYSTETHDALSKLGQAFSQRLPTRRLIVRKLFQRATEHQLLTIDVAIGARNLLPYEDALYWMTQWGALSPSEQRLAVYAVRIAKPEDPAELQTAQSARAAHPSLREATAHWDMPPPARPGNDRAAQLRRDSYSETALRQAISLVHQAQTDDLRSAWLNVLREIRKTADGSPAHQHTPLSIARQAPSYPSAGSELAHELQQAAMYVLAHVPPLTAADLTPHGSVAWHAMPEITAFAVLGANETLALTATAEHAAGWTIAIASASIYDNADVQLRDQLLPHFAARAGSALGALLTEVLCTATATTVQGMVGGLAAHALEQSRSALLAWAIAPERTPEQWGRTLHELAANQDSKAREVLRAELAEDPASHAPDSPSRARWLVAAHALMYRDNHLATVLPDVWPAVRPHLSNPEILTQLLNRLSSTSSNWPDGTGTLTARQLGDLYTLILGHLGAGVLKSPYHRVGIIGPQHRLHDLVRSLPSLIASQETPQAAAELHQLADLHPEAWFLRRDARSTARAAAARHATPLPPAELLRLADNVQLRRVTDERQLHDIVVESLHRFEQALHRPNGLVIALWNRDRPGVNHDRWWPCWEEDFSDIVAAFLLQDIGGHRVVINREVQLRRPGLPGLRTDIQIEAPGAPGGGEDPIKVVIECKGCWNSSLPTALADQLVTDYLHTPRTAGIFLVGYFDCERWGIHKRQCPAHGHTSKQIHEYQQEQARQQHAKTGSAVSAFVVDCRLPGREHGEIIDRG